MSGKTFEALDVVRFALPNVLEIDPIRTAGNPDMVSYLRGRGWGSYGPLWKRMPRIWKGVLSNEEIATWWKTTWLIDGMKALRDHYASDGSWYPLTQDVRSIGGVRFRSSARGVLFSRIHGPEVHVINPRKTQTIDPKALSFLARAAYEEYAIDDPNNPSIAVLDLGSVKKSKVRSVRMFRGDIVDMIHVDHFEHVVNSFLEALRIADSASFGSVRAVRAAEFRMVR